MPDPLLRLHVRLNRIKGHHMEQEKGKRNVAKEDF